MDRRPRDIPPEDRYGGGQSYRPGNVRQRSPFRGGRDDDRPFRRSPPRRDFDNRRPPFRPRSRSPFDRGGFRRRSPTPPRFAEQRAGDGYRFRPNSPPRQEMPESNTPRRADDMRRNIRDEPFRNERRFGDDRLQHPRSPARAWRDRSPPKDDRARSPMSARGRRTPPPRRFSPQRMGRPRSPIRSPPRRSPPRRLSPRGGDRDYPSRPRSPVPRNDNTNFADRTAENWRRARSPASVDTRQDLDTDRSRDSLPTSRRSSPPLHASRLALIQDRDGTRSGRPSPRSNFGDVQARPIAQSPPRRFASPPRERDADVAMAGNNPPRDDRRPDTFARPAVEDDVDSKREPPSGPRETRAPPTGPRAPVAPSAVPPAGPRGDAMPVRGGFTSMRGRGSYTADFTGRGRGAPPNAYQADRNAAPPFARGPSYERDTGYVPSPNVPSGPRNFSGPPPRPGINRGPSQAGRFDSSEPQQLLSRPPRPRMEVGPPDADWSQQQVKRAGNGVHPALRDLPEVVTNGRKLPPPVDQTRLKKLEEESEKLRKLVQEKDAKKRKSMREWERLVRESEGAAFRSELTDECVRAYELEAESIRPAF